MQLNNELINKIKITPIIDSLRLENIDDDEYFSEKYSNYISNSRLGLLKSKGAKAFFEGIKSEYNPSFQFGTWLHEQVLQPESFNIVEGIYKPTAKAGLMADYLYKNVVSKDGGTPSDDQIKSASYIIGYYKDKLTSNRLNEFRLKSENYWRDRYIFEQTKGVDSKRVYVDEKSHILIKNCLNSINSNNEIQKLLHPKGIVEDPYVGFESAILLDIEATVPEYGSQVYRLKAKLDNFSIDKEENIITVNDLKTTSKLANEFDPDYYSYQREIAGYTYLLNLCAKKFFEIEKPINKGNFLVVSIIPEYNSCVVPMTNKMFAKGWNEYKFLLKTVAYLNLVEGYNFAS